jgi:hypothetical protein
MVAYFKSHLLNEFDLISGHVPVFARFETQAFCDVKGCSEAVLL